jgi:hypothetical protein
MTKQYVYKDWKDGDVGWLEITCPECGAGGYMEYIGGNMAPRSQLVPTYVGVFWRRGGPLHGFRCESKQHCLNWDEIPDHCWSVHFFTEKERAEWVRGQERLREYLEKHTDPKTGIIVLQGTRQRPVG